VIADKLSLNITDHKCLDLIERMGPMTAGQLAKITGLTTGAITGVIDRLEKAGYVQRERDPQDRRRVIVSLVPDKAYNDIAPLFEVLRRNYDPISKGYSDEELAVILRFMKESNQVLKETIAILREDG
jgi:DNA-binding MarR family transcriptional regulator